MLSTHHSARSLLAASVALLSACGSCEGGASGPVIERPEACEIAAGEALDCETPTNDEGTVRIDSPDAVEQLCTSRCRRAQLVTVVGFDFTFSDLSFLSHLSTIRQLRLAGRFQSLEGLASADITNLDIGTTEVLRVVDGFDGIISLDGFLFDLNEDVEAVRGFDNVTSFESSTPLRFQENPRLKTIDAFNQLPSVGAFGTLQIANNAQLSAIEGFRVLERGQFLIITANPELTKISGLSNMKDFELIQIEGNPKLTQCEIDRTLANLNPEVRVVVSNNGPEGPCPD